MLMANAISVLKSIPGLRAVRRALTPQPIEFPPAMEGSYHHYGYLIFDPGISMDLIDRAATEMMNRPGMSGATHHGTRWFDGWRESDPIRKIALAPKVLRLLSQIYDRKPCPFQTINFPIGTEQKVHSDWIHFACDPPGYMCGVWVAFEDIDLGNGALVYYPGSHKLPFVTMDDIYPNGGPDKYHLYEEHMERLVREKNLKPERAILKKGEALLWAANLLHGGGSHPDKSRTRMSQVTHYFFEGCQYYSPLSSAGGYRHMKKKDWIR